MRKKTPTKKRLAVGHRYNPWRSVEPMPTDRLVETMTAIRFAEHALLAAARLYDLPGICHTCGCTDLAACDPPCRWVDARHTRCSRCRAPTTRTARRA